MLKLPIEMRKIKISVIAGGLGVLVLVAAIFVSQQVTVRADAPSVVINEIMYNPHSDVDNDEFLELYNTTGSTIDLSGWCFTRGITLCFSTGTTLASHAYGTISPNAARTLSTYGVATIATYTGKLDNGGERITLVDAAAHTVNDLTYDDVAPWSVTPDGTGPSLELKDPSLDNTLAASWSASVGAPTPGAVNSVFANTQPSLSNMSQPLNVTASQTSTITVAIADANTVELVYKVMFGAEQTLPMHDDGTNGDTTPGDGVYTASIPAQAAGTLVRYKVMATNTNGTKTLPGSDDTIQYQGYVIQDPAVTSQVPILQWFMEDSARDDMIANHDFDDQQFPTVIAYGNQVFDNARVHIKGGVKRTFPKKSFAFDLPKGHKLKINSNMTRAVDEFHLDSDFIDPSGTSVTVAWQIAKEAGLDVQQIFKVRLQNNAGFYGLYTFLEEDDKTWRQAFGYDNTSYYGINGPINDLVADHAYEIQLWHDPLVQPRSQARRDYAVDNSDIPNMINYMAYMTIIHNCEWQNGKNMIKSHDVLDTNRWKILAHDIDCTMFYTGPSADGGGSTRLMNSFDVPSNIPFSADDRYEFNAIYEEPDFRQDYYRRLRTLADEFFDNDRYLGMIHDLYQRIEPEAQMDAQKWSENSYGSPENALQNFTTQYYKTKKDLLVRFRYNGVVPASQSSNPIVDISGVHSNVSNHQEDYIKLKNNTSEAIDVSGWSIPEIQFTIPGGAALAPGQEAYIPRKDAIFKLNHTGYYVLGQFKQDLPTLGEVTLERADSTVSDTQDLTI